LGASFNDLLGKRAQALARNSWLASENFFLHLLLLEAI